MSRPWQDFSPKSSPYHYVSDNPVVDVYGGPEEQMEIGARGFLVHVLPGKEELGIDDALDLLRQATIKIYGGIKPKSKKTDVTKGYVKIDFAEPSTIKVLPFPPGEVDDEIEPEPEKTEETPEKQNGGAKTQPEAAKPSKDASKTPTAPTDKKAPAAADDKTKNKTEVAAEQGDKKTEAAPEKKEEPSKEVVWMKASYKFKAFKTEIKTLIFVKSNVPDPLKVANAAMEIVATRKTLEGEALRQVLPALGVCQFEQSHVEAMANRVLGPLFDESEGEKSFSVIVMDKLSSPGADSLIETIRNVIWSINPSAMQASPLIEPDYVIRLEIIGKKLVLSCLTHFIRYRHYHPRSLVDSGLGELEDDDGTWVPTEVRKMQEAIRAEREKRRELERQKEEENRKEREKRREEAEARRRERMKEEKEREERRKLEREKEREQREKERKLKEEAKNAEKEAAKKAEESKEKEVKPKEGQTTEQKTAEQKTTEQKSAEKPTEQKAAQVKSSTESPPAKKAKVEEPVPAKADDVVDDDKKESQQVKGVPATRGGRKKSK